MQRSPPPPPLPPLQIRTNIWFEGGEQWTDQQGISGNLQRVLPYISSRISLLHEYDKETWAERTGQGDVMVTSFKKTVAKAWFPWTIRLQLDKIWDTIEHSSAWSCSGLITVLTVYSLASSAKDVTGHGFCQGFSPPTREDLDVRNSSSAG